MENNVERRQRFRHSAKEPYIRVERRPHFRHCTNDPYIRVKRKRYHGTNVKLDVKAVSLFFASITVIIGIYFLAGKTALKQPEVRVASSKNGGIIFQHPERKKKSLRPQLKLRKTMLQGKTGANNVKKHKKGKIIYLTIDDGPCKWTNDVLDVLDKHQVKATYFVTAQFAKGDELIKMLKEIDKRGHVLAVHSYSHEYKSIYHDPTAFWKDYEKMDDLIFEATGKRSKLLRFPGGSNAGYNAAIRQDLLREVHARGLVYHDWNAFNGDTDGITTDEMVNKAVSEATYNEKSVLLTHDIPTMKGNLLVFDQMIEQLIEKGYRFETMDETTPPVQFVKATE